MYVIKRAKTPLEYFEQLSAIPRRSHDEEKVSGALCDFAAEQGFYAGRDGVGNVLIHKGGSAGREGEETLILQAHMDMVFVTDDEENQPYGKPLTLVRDGNNGRISAKDSSLGADNGLGMAMALALLSDEELSHPPLDAVFTVNEEDGLEGANKIDPALLRGGRLINMDNEAENTVTVGCAGAFRSELSLPFEREDAEGYRALEIKLGGLMGGHSGLEIDKGRANACKLLGKLLWKLGERTDVRLVSFSGGSHMNSIPKTAEATLAVAEGGEAEVKEYIRDLGQEIASCLSGEDGGFKLSAEAVSLSEKVLKAEDGRRILRALLLLPSGVIQMSKDVEGLVQTSTNLGIVRMERDRIVFVSNPRSSLAFELSELGDLYKAIAESLGGSATEDSAYPPWPYAEISPLRDAYEAAYERLYGLRLKEEILHGGLECGVLCEKKPGLDALCIGPDIANVHSTAESFDVKSLERVYACIKELLRTI